MKDSYFTNTIRDNPGDSGPVLVYADWLEERGKCDKAELLRSAVELKEMPNEWAYQSPRNAKFDQLVARIVALSLRRGNKRLYTLLAMQNWFGSGASDIRWIERRRKKRGKFVVPQSPTFTTVKFGDGDD